LVSQITDQELEDRIIQSDTFVCVAFLQAGVQDDARFLNEYVRAAAQLPDYVEFYWINATENPSISTDQQIKKTPTTILYICSNEIARYAGFYDAAFLVKEIGEWTKKRRCP
jgi:hypothetical protein